MSWDELSMAEKAEVMRIAVEGGVYDLDAIRNGYNEFAKGGKIHIKPENRGKFTRLKERTGKSASWFKEHGTPAQKKMAVFALNARNWKHGDGGNLYGGGSFMSLIPMPIVAPSNTKGGQKQRKILQFLPIVGTAIDAEEAIYNPTGYNIAKTGISAASDLFGASLLRGAAKGVKLLKTEGAPTAAELLSPWTRSEVKETINGGLRYGMPATDSELDILETVKPIKKKKSLGGNLFDSIKV